jgi:hypothetical protein
MQSSPPPAALNRADSPLPKPQLTPTVAVPQIGDHEEVSLPDLKVNWLDTGS